MKAKIWYKTPHWYSKLPPNGLEQKFLTPQAAMFSVESYYKRQNRFLKAEQIIFDLRSDLLSIEEQDLVDRISREQKCFKKQYGWLKGILERQKV